MQRNGALVRKKYMEYLGSTLAYSLSIYLAAIVDGILVGQLLGPVPMMAINFTTPVVYTKNIVFMLFINGGSTIAARYLGERRMQDADRIFTMSVIGCVAGYSLLWLFGTIFSGPLTVLLSGGGASYDEVAAYLFPLFAMGPFFAFSSGVAAYIRLDGRHALATAVPVVANTINLVCDYIFIRFFGWGIAGAGWATVTGYGLSILLLVPYFRSRDRHFHFVKVTAADLKLYPECFKVGLPMAFIQACNVIRNYTMNSVTNSIFGDAGGQVISVCNNALFYAIMFAEGSATAMSSVCSTLFGEKDVRGIKSVLKRALFTATAICLSIFLLLELFPVQFGLLYKVTDQTAQEMLRRFLRIFLLYVPLLAPLYGVRAFYQATKHTTAATVISILEGAGITVPIFLILSALSPNVMWLSNCLGAILSLGIVMGFMGKKAKDVGIGGADAFLMLREETEDRTCEFSLSANVTDAERASEEAIAFLKQCDVPGKVCNAMGVAAEELCVNISRYAKVPKTEQIDVFLRVQADRVLMKLRDSGIAFNPTEFIGDTGEQITGLSLIRATGCEIEYDRIIGFNSTIITASWR